MVFLTIPKKCVISASSLTPLPPSSSPPTAADTDHTAGTPAPGDTDADAPPETELPTPTPPPPSSSPLASEDEQEALYGANDFWAYVDDLLVKMRNEARRVCNNEVPACNAHMDR